MSYSSPFFNTLGHIFLNNTGRRLSVNKDRRKRLNRLEKSFPSFSVPLFAFAAFFHCFLVSLPFYFCLVQKFKDPSLEVAILSLQLILSSCWSRSFLIHAAWMLVYSVSTGTFNFQEIHSAVDRTAAYWLQKTIFATSTDNPPKKTKKTLHLNSIFVVLHTVHHTSLYTSTMLH